MTKSVINLNRLCAICRKKEVNRWCDFIIKYDNHLTFFRDHKMFLEANQRGSDYETCDLPMCEDCAKNVSLDTDMCPHHNNLLFQVDLPDAYQRARQAKEKGKIASEIIRGAD